MQNAHAPRQAELKRDMAFSKPWLPVRAVISVAAVLVAIGASLLALWLFEGSRRPVNREDVAAALRKSLVTDGQGHTYAEAPSMWVRIVNPEPIANANKVFPPKSTCITREGGRVKVLQAKDETLLLRYSAPYRSGGTACPDGTLFTLSAR